MQCSDLKYLALNLKEKAKKTQFVPYLGGIQKANEVVALLTICIDGLHNDDPSTSCKKVDKEIEKTVKQVLYQIETLLREIEILKKEKDSTYMKKYAESTTAPEIARILEETSVFSNSLAGLSKSGNVVGSKYLTQKEELIKTLLDPGSNPVIPILGESGSGKSTLAGLAFNDSSVKAHFTSKRWISFTYYSSYQNLVCQAIQCLGQGMCMLSSSNTPSGLDSLLTEFQTAALGSKCLLVLDDVSDVEVLKSLLSVNDDNPMYSEFLDFAASGSKIVMTSSLENAGASSPVCPLRLDTNESWGLFQTIISQHKERPPASHYVRLRVQRKCQNIPGVINIVASILSSKSTTEERVHFLDDIMPSLPDPTGIIASIHKLIEPSCDNNKQTKLRHCFAWCSLLPRDCEFRKDYIIKLWKAQEVFGAYNVTEEELEQCFAEFLTSRYFIEVDSNNGSSTRYKISSLVFELMKYVAGDDFCFVDASTTTEPDQKIIRHASFVIDSSWEPPSWLLEAKQLRSLLLWPTKSGELISLTQIELILSRMIHLQTLYADAVHCEQLSLFSEKFKRLEHLRLGAVSIVSLPKDVPILLKLINYRLSVEEQLLLDFCGLKKLTIYYNTYNEQHLLENTGEILVSLVSQGVETLELRQWKGITLPRWVTDELSLHLNGLLSIQIANCGGCLHLPGFDTLPYLTSLQLLGLSSLVDIEITRQGTETETELTKPFYRSLKHMILCDLPKLKGWISKERDDNQHILNHSFPVLTQIKVQGCPNLVSMPAVPTLESLEAVNVEPKLLGRLLSSPVIKSNHNQEITTEASISHIKYLEINGGKYFGKEDDIPNALASIHSLKLTNNPELESLPEYFNSITGLEQLSLCWLANLKVVPGWIGEFTHLRQLVIHYCPKLTMLPSSNGGFYALEELEIRYCPKLTQFPKSFPNLKKLRVQEFTGFEQILLASQNLEELEINSCCFTKNGVEIEDDTRVAVWEGLKRMHFLKLVKMESLSEGINFEKLGGVRRVVIHDCPKLCELPHSLGKITALEHLQINRCPRLKKLPDNFSNLSSLRELEIRVSPKLEKKCEKDNGEYWGYIQHIPNLIFSDSTAVVE